MKEQLTASAERTCRLLSDTMVSLLETKPLEKISVTDICAVSKVPRATFYNYFEDKFDLLRFAFRTVARPLLPEGELSGVDYAKVLFNNFLDIAYGDGSFVPKVINANYNSIFFAEMKDFVYEIMLRRLRLEEENGVEFNTDLRMIAEFYTNGIVYSAKTFIERKSVFSREDFCNALDRLLYSVMFGFIGEKEE